MLTTQEALDALLRAAVPLAAAETVATESAVGRVLSEDVLSPIDVPPMDVSAMDGYAIRLADWPVPADAESADVAAKTVAPAAVSAASGVTARMAISQRIPAGVFPTPLESGTAARIFTGAPLPSGADAIIPQEDAETVADGVCFRGERPVAGRWVNRRGGDIAAGAVVLEAGTRLTPQALGLAASIGRASVQVARRLRVALVFTGDELRRPGDPLTPGAIYNSNRYTLGGLLDKLGCEATDYGIVADQLEATRTVLREAARTHDVVLTSGGVSVGEEDHVKAAVEAEGSLALWKIAMKPGKPLAFGTLRRGASAAANAANGQGDAYFIGLPGNPVSTFVTFLLFVRPFLLRLQGVVDVAPKAMFVRANFSQPADRRNEFLRVRLGRDGAQVAGAQDGLNADSEAGLEAGLEAFPNQSSGVLTSTVWGDGLVDNPPGNRIAVGDFVRFIPFAGLVD